MKIPLSLYVVVGILVLGFLLSMIGAVRKKSKESKYQKLNGAGTAEASQHTLPSGGPESYQNSNYVLPPPQKVVTYCVIDGRLVDE